MTRDGLADYLARQLDHFFPMAPPRLAPASRAIMGEALGRLNRCINAVKMWPQDRFHYLHSEQNTIFLAYLANTVWRNRQDATLATKLFYLNKTLNGFHCFYDTDLPDRFFVGHSLGIVLVRLKYPEYFAIYQNCTVGKNHGAAPTLEEGIVMYPGSGHHRRLPCRRPQLYRARLFSDRRRQPGQLPGVQRPTASPSSRPPSRTSWPTCSVSNPRLPIGFSWCLPAPDGALCPLRRPL